MSGRKAGEVISLLRSGANTRSAGKANFRRSLEEFMSSVPSNEQKYNSLFNKIQTTEFNFSDEARKECADECKQLETRLKNLKAVLTPVHYDIAYAKNIDSEYERQFLSLDSKANRIHDAVSSKYHYCDDEYRRAQNIISEYKSLVSKQKQTESDFKNKIAASNQDVSRAEIHKKQLEEMIDTASSIDRKAKDIVNLRNKAKDACSFIEKAGKSIDKNIAEKFLSERYHSLLAEMERFLKSSDSEIVREFNLIQKKVSLFKQDLDDKYASFTAAKTAAEKNINETYSLLTKDAFYDALEYIKKGDQANVLHLFDFLKSYAAGEFVSEINDNFKKAKDAFVKEDFTMVHDILGKTVPVISAATEKAALVQEENVRNIYNMTKLRDALMSLNFKVKMEIIDGKIKITASAGDERIIFENDDNGGLAIDHHEGTQGTCPDTWKNIHKACRAHDFILPDVKKNGKSVIYDTPASQTSSQNTKERSRL